MRPVCPICGEKHFAREPHIFKSEVKPLHEVLRVKVVTPAVVTPVAMVVTSTSKVVTTKGASRHGKYLDEKKRAEYLRNYMKTKRAIKSGRAVALPR